MPLLSGESNIGKNIKMEMAHGKKKKQAVAIALDKARSPGVKIMGNMLKLKRKKL